MTDNEYGPFANEREALATRAAAVIRAAYDAHPGVGASVPESLKVMTDACEAHGVALGKLDLSFLQGVAWGETFYSISLAGMITRAYEAGKAAAAVERAETEWGVRFTDGGLSDHACGSEGHARAVVASMRQEGAVLVTRVPARAASPWTVAEEPATGEKGEGSG